MLCESFNRVGCLVDPTLTRLIHSPIGLDRLRQHGGGDLEAAEIGPVIPLFAVDDIRTQCAHWDLVDQNRNAYVPQFGLLFGLPAIRPVQGNRFAADAGYDDRPAGMDHAAQGSFGETVESSVPGVVVAM
jgi:hypothetical protein